MTERSEFRTSEEAVVCTLMRQIGKLLVAFYLETEWDQLRRKAAAEHISDSIACGALLGVTFEEIGIEAADRWRLPETIRTGMLTRDPLAPIDEKNAAPCALAASSHELFHRSRRCAHRATCR